MSLSDSVIEGLGRLRVTQGEGEGRLLTVFPWQRRFIRGALQDGVEESALSVSRGCGKTTLCAGIATAALSGPLSATRGETVCVATHRRTCSESSAFRPPCGKRRPELPHVRHTGNF